MLWDLPCNCTTYRIISEFVRFHPMSQNHKSCEDFYDVVQLGEVIYMDLSSPKTVWSNITSKNSNVIRKVLKNDIKIYNGRFQRSMRNLE